MRTARTTLVRNAAWLACLAMVSTACMRENATSSEASVAAATEEVMKPLSPAATMHPDDIASVTGSFDCDGIRVDIIRDQVARVNLAVDNIIKIERIQNSVPATYQDAGLTFTVSDSGANLDDETGRSIACRRVDKPGDGTPAAT